MKITKYTLSTLIFGLFFSVFPLQAVIVEGEQGTLGNKTITFLSDRYLSNSSLINKQTNNRQKDDFIDCTTHLQNTLVIAVDPLDFSGIPLGVLTHDELQAIKNSINKQMGADGTLNKHNFLNDLCKNKNINIYNTEFRQVQFVSTCRELPTLKSIEIAEKIIAEIDGYDDPDNYKRICDAINKYPARINAKLKELLESEDSSREITKEIALETLKTVGTDYEDYPLLTNKFTYKQLKSVVEALNDNKLRGYGIILTLTQRNNLAHQGITHPYDVLRAERETIEQYQSQKYQDCLIIPRILHAIYTAKQSNIIVCADEQHIKSLTNLLSQIGYQHNRQETIYSAQYPSSITLSEFMEQTQPNTYIGATPQPVPLPQIESHKPNILRWLKIGLGIAAGTAIAYTLYKRFFKS